MASYEAKLKAITSNDWRITPFETVLRTLESIAAVDVSPEAQYDIAKALKNQIRLYSTHTDADLSAATYLQDVLLSQCETTVLQNMHKDSELEPLLGVLSYTQNLVNRIGEVHMALENLTVEDIYTMANLDAKRPQIYDPKLRYISILREEQIDALGELLRMESEKFLETFEEIPQDYRSDSATTAIEKYKTIKALLQEARENTIEERAKTEHRVYLTEETPLRNLSGLYEVVLNIFDNRVRKRKVRIDSVTEVTESYHSPTTSYSCFTVPLPEEGYSTKRGMSLEEYKAIPAISNFDIWLIEDYIDENGEESPYATYGEEELEILMPESEVLGRCKPLIPPRGNEEMLNEFSAAKEYEELKVKEEKQKKKQDDIFKNVEKKVNGLIEDAMSSTITPPSIGTVEVDDFEVTTPAETTVFPVTPLISKEADPLDMMPSPQEAADKWLEKADTQPTLPAFNPVNTITLSPEDAPNLEPMGDDRTEPNESELQEMWSVLNSENETDTIDETTVDFNEDDIIIPANNEGTLDVESLNIPEDDGSDDTMDEEEDHWSSVDFDQEVAVDIPQEPTGQLDVASIQLEKDESWKLDDKEPTFTLKISADDDLRPKDETEN